MGIEGGLCALAAAIALILLVVAVVDRWLLGGGPGTLPTLGGLRGRWEGSLAEEGVLGQGNLRRNCPQVRLVCLLTESMQPSDVRHEGCLAAAEQGSSKNKTGTKTHAKTLPGRTLVCAPCGPCVGHQTKGDATLPSLVLSPNFLSANYKCLFIKEDLTTQDNKITTKQERKLAMMALKMKAWDEVTGKGAEARPPELMAATVRVLGSQKAKTGKPALLFAERVREG